MASLQLPAEPGRDGALESPAIGQLARRLRIPVRTIRYWSDIGAVPPAGRSDGGHRLYDAAGAARLELVRTLRELGLGLVDVRRVLEREVTVADVAAAHVAALDAQIRSLRLARSVLSAVAALSPGTEEMTLMNKLARLSARERARVIDDFVADVFEGLSPSPELKNKLRLTAPELPDEPTPEQVAAWIGLAELAQDPGFRQRMRAMARYHAGTHAERRREASPEGEPGAAPLGFSQPVTSLVAPARERGVEPGSSEAGELLDQLLAGAGPARRAYIRERVAAGAASQSDRYHELLAVLNGERARPSRVADLEWLRAALDAHRA